MARIIVETRGFKKIGARYRNHPRFQALAKRRMHSLGLVLRRLAQEEAPKDEHKLERGIGFRVEPARAGASLVLISKAGHTPYVLTGTRPHMPPVSAIAPWARRHGMDPWAVAMGIKKGGTSWGAVRKYGTRANPFLVRANRKAGRRYKRGAIVLTQDFAAYLNGTGGVVP